MLTNYKIFCPIFGLCVWLVATLLIWSYGDAIFAQMAGAAMGMIYGVVAVLMSMLTLIIISRYQLGIWQRLQAAILLVLPSMVLDTFAIQQFADWFPMLKAEHLGRFASLMMWAYAVVIGTALISRLWAGED